MTNYSLTEDDSQTTNPVTTGGSLDCCDDGEIHVVGDIVYVRQLLFSFTMRNFVNTADPH